MTKPALNFPITKRFFFPKWYTIDDTFRSKSVCPQQPINTSFSTDVGKMNSQLRLEKRNMSVEFDVKRKIR